MIDENEYYRMRNMYEDEAYRAGEFAQTLSEIDFLVESSGEKSETLSRIAEVLGDCPVHYPKKRNFFEERK